MKTFNISILEVMRVETGKKGFLTALPKSVAFQPGQFFAASREEPSPLPAVLYPHTISPNGCLFLTDDVIPWLVGEQVALRGPLGRGFSPPQNTARVALVAMSDQTTHLHLLMSTCLHNGAALVLCSDRLPPDLPPQVELLPLAQLPEAGAWADYLAVDCPPQRLPRLLRTARDERVFASRPVQVLVRRVMPCAGLGACGVCAQKTRRGYALACQDGPVFDLAQLEVE